MRVTVKYVGESYSGEYIANHVIHEFSVYGGYTTSAAIENICYTLILRKDEIVLWTNGNRFTIDKDNVRNVWASNVIFLEDTNDKIYIIGYNHNNRLGTNKPAEEFLYCEPFDLFQEEFEFLYE